MLVALTQAYKLNALKFGMLVALTQAYKLKALKFGMLVALTQAYKLKLGMLVAITYPCV